MAAVSFCARRCLLKNYQFSKTFRRHGYIVLVPEIGDDLPEKNPLLKEDKLPEFNSLTIEKCTAAIAKQSVEYEQTVTSIEFNLRANEDKNVNIVKHIFKPLEELTLSLNTTWGIAKTLYFGNKSLMPTKNYMGIHNRVLEARTAKFNSIPIYQACKKVKEGEEFSKLSYEDQRILSKFLLEGRLNGLELTGKRRNEYLYSLKKMGEHIELYSRKLQKSTSMFKHTIRDPDSVKEIPEDFLRLIAVNPMEPQRGPWVVTLKPHIAIPFIEYCPERMLRWNIWNANMLRSSLYQDRVLQTSTSLEEIRFRRIEQAKFLGYKNYAEMSMATKMAGSVENVYNVLDTLLETARPAQEREIEELEDFASKRSFNEKLRQWDVPYWSRKYRRSVYKLKEELLKDYFPLPKVLAGLFQLMESLFNIKIVEVPKVDVWHKDVRFFQVFDESLKDAGNQPEPIGGFYFDPYARADEKIRVSQNSGFHVNIRNRSYVDNSMPLSALIFNFQPPIYGKPSLLLFSDVVDLFHQFGGAMQHLLTRVNRLELSGTANIEWDVSSVCSNFMVHWLYEPSTLKLIAGHYDTDEPLSNETIESIKSMRSHLAGYNLCKELYLARYDLELYSSEKFWGDMMEPLWKKHFAIPYEKKDSHICSFEAIFTGGWAAGYYSTIWSQMLAADIYGAFQENTNENARSEISKRYRDTFLALGGSVPGAEVFRRFRGRDPSPKALLKNLGLRNVSSKKEHLLTSAPKIVSY